MKIKCISSLLFFCAFLRFNGGCTEQVKNIDLHVFYYSTVEFVETPLSFIKGSIPLTEEEAMKRNHYRFTYNQKNQLVAVSFFNGTTPKKPNHTANLFTLSHLMKFEYSEDRETISFFNTQNEPQNVLGNCSRFVYTHNDLGFRNRLYFLDQDNERITNSWGIYEYSWEYLHDGSVIENRFDKSGNLVAIRPGFEFYRLRLYFNPSGHIALMQNIDENCHLVENSSGASQDKIITNSHGNFLEWNVLNNEHELEKGNGPNVATGKQEFNHYGYEVSLTHQDENEQVIASEYGIYISKTQFDPYGNIQERTFYNAQGLPVKHSKAGYHKLRLTWDAQGNKRKGLHYYDENGAPCVHSTRGYHSVDYSYDGQGRISKISYYSISNELVNRSDNGRAYSTFEYPENGEVIVRHFTKSNAEIPQ